MKQSLFTMEHARQLTADTYELVLSGDTSAITAPGQFVNIQLPGKFLRRPISICNWTKDALLLLVRVVGEGTHDLVRCVPGTELDVLSGLGNGFDLAKGGAHPILLGGGIVHDRRVVCGLRDMCSKIAPIRAYPGEFEMEALAAGALRALRGEEPVLTYTGVPVFQGFEAKYPKA